MSDKFGEGRDPYLYPGLDIMRNRLNIRQQQRRWNRSLTK